MTHSLTHSLVHSHAPTAPLQPPSRLGAAIIGRKLPGASCVAAGEEVVLMGAGKKRWVVCASEHTNSKAKSKIDSYLDGHSAMAAVLEELEDIVANADNDNVVTLSSVSAAEVECYKLVAKARFPLMGSGKVSDTGEGRQYGILNFVRCMIISFLEHNKIKVAIESGDAASALLGPMKKTEGVSCGAFGWFSG